MLIANLRDGQTVSFDLCTKEGFSNWEAFQRKTNGQITGLSISHRKYLHTFPRPLQGDAQDFGADILKAKDSQKITAERIWTHLGKVRITLTVYKGRTPVTRVDVKKVGEVRFRPRR